MLLFIVASGLLPRILIKLGLMEEKVEDEVDEQLGTYNQCLGKKDRKAWLIEEAHQRKNLRIQSVNDEMYEKLRNPAKVI